ncbi:DsbC family protein [Pseudomarimonas arenosa]|uniref:Thiol:disulfide interchange protein n=1 Tax=Pseudomarimonas arenosa TaxID=2774145 RepID=A0AAW3ZK16_9GAMM|nr:DsbC family protein [Pseudomarimonas arenosa]MBD8526458.1 DsbC family protein [Pseudomarimonas arenosa]
MLKTSLLAAALALGSSAVLAADVEPSAVSNAIKSLVPDAKIDSIAESRLKGLYEVVLGGQVVYVSEDGKYLVQGSLFDVGNRQDLTELARAKLRKQGLADAAGATRIVYAPKSPKYTMTVFTDIDCGYCRRMHAQMQEYNDRGIAIEYLFFPRAGAGSESFQKAVSVWCADDRAKALTEAKSGVALDKKECANPIAEQFDLGARIGVSGTPAVYTSDGVQVGGYVPPDDLLKTLEKMAASK